VIGRRIFDATCARMVSLLLALLATSLLAASRHRPG